MFNRPQWSNLTSTEKKLFEDLACEMKAIYEEQVAEWREHGRHNGRVLGDDYVHARLSHFSFDGLTAADLWSEEVAIEWYRTTGRLVQEQTTEEACLTTIAKQWDMAKQHLQGELKEILSEGLAEMKESLTSKFLQHRERSRRCK